MDAEQIKRATKQLAGLFSGQVTQEIAQLIRKDFAPFDFKCTTAAIEEHKRSRQDGFLNYFALLAAVRAAARPPAPDATNTTSREGTWCDIYRRQNPQLAQAGDHEVILRVHWGWWQRCPKTNVWSDKLRREARALLERFGMDPKSAAEWAEMIFEDVPTMRLALDQLRGNLPAMAG